MGSTPFQTEAWTEYGIGTLVLLLRYFARWHSVGFKEWKGDDWFAVAVLVFWTLELVMLELIGRNGTNIGIYDEVGATLSEEQIAKLEFGSKCLLMGWNFYVTLIWALKGVMLCYYNRITLGLRQQVFVKWTGVATIFAYAAVLGSIWGSCVPVQKQWQVYPYPGDQCAMGIPIYLTLVVMNVVTDVAILSIPVPLLWKVKITLMRKLAVGVLLCSGIFIIVATILRCVLSLQDINGINTSTIWAIRETFVGIIAVNAAAIKPLFSRSRWISSGKGSSGDKYKNGYPLSSVGADPETGGRTGTLGSSKRAANNTVRDIDEMSGGSNSSEEHINKPHGGLDYHNYISNDIRADGATGRSVGPAPEGGITVTTRVEIDNQKSNVY